ncbi:MAG: GGDEF domain-containing protein [Lachnospiraceae bacterium]|nr:GGDEF domain-containing protein [Lachnospiraceae bacterium]
MSSLNYQNYVKYHKWIHRFIYWAIILLGVCMHIFKSMQIKMGTWMYAFFLGVLFFYVGNEALALLNYFDSYGLRFGFKLFELVAYSIIIAKIPSDPLTMCIGLAFVILLSVEFALYDTDYDKSKIVVRKILIAIYIAINYGVFVTGKKETYYVIHFLVDAVILLVIYFIIDWLSGQSKSYDRERNELLVKISDVDKANNSLQEYHERIKSVNEQINYQKIELMRAYKDMEETNRDIAAQTDVLKYAVSTFDIQKIVEVIANSIVEVRKASLCALFIDSNVYMNKQPLVTIKTDYASIERRLKKDIEQIYRDFIQDNNQPVTYDEEHLSEFRFVGDTNIKSLTFFPLLEGRKRYGFMIVCSKNEDYFKRGLGIFESDLVGLSLAIKNTNTYLKMQDIARHDGLTGMYNRLYFNELFSAAVKQAVKKGMPISVAIYDIDNFKSVNDTYGHLVGDEVIKMVAKAGDMIAKKYNGFACRYGGEEFLIVLPNHDAGDALPIFEELHEQIKSKQVKNQDMRISVDVCIGVSSYPTTCNNTDLLISRADKAMYYGKRHGRGRLIMDSDSLDY